MQPVTMRKILSITNDMDKNREIYIYIYIYVCMYVCMYVYHYFKVFFVDSVLHF